MSYEERVKRVLEVAGDYNAIVSGLNLERAMYLGTINSAREKIQKLVESLSMDDISLSVNSSGYLILGRKDRQGVECLYKNALYDSCYRSNAAGTVFRNDLEDLILRAASRASRTGGARLSDVAKFVRYSSLILASVDEEVINTIKAAAMSYDRAKCDLDLNTNKYGTYVAAISSELRFLAQDWYKEKAIFVPGMKIGVTDLRTGKTTIRTIKRVKDTGTGFAIALNETASIITDPARINKELTWYLNTKVCSDIAKVIKWRPVANFI